MGYRVLVRAPSTVLGCARGIARRARASSLRPGAASMVPAPSAEAAVPVTPRGVASAPSCARASAHPFGGRVAVSTSERPRVLFARRRTLAAPSDARPPWPPVSPGAGDRHRRRGCRGGRSRAGLAAGRSKLGILAVPALLPRGPTARSAPARQAIAADQRGPWRRRRARFAPDERARGRERRALRCSRGAPTGSGGYRIDEYRSNGCHALDGR